MLFALRAGEPEAFYALPPSASPASELSAVHEWRKEERKDSFRV